MSNKVVPTKIEETSKGGIFFYRGDKLVTTCYITDILMRGEGGDSNFLKIQRKGLSLESAFEIDCSSLTSIVQKDATTESYTAIDSSITSGASQAQEDRVGEVYEYLFENIFSSCCSTSTSDGGDCVANPLLDSSDTQVTTIAEGQSVKMVTSGMTHALVGSVREITCPVVTPPIKAVPLIHQLPGYSSILTGDYADVYSTINTFYEYADACKLMKQGADAYTLHADTPNPFGATRRYTTDDGTGSGAGTARITTFGSATDYIVCDWLYRIMWYVANLDQRNLSTFITEVAARNTAADIWAKSDWKCATNLVYMMSARPDRASDINSGMNILLDGIVSGFNPGSDARNLTNAHYAQSTGNVRIHFAGTSNIVAQTVGYTTETTGYMWRHITDADITAMGGTP